MGKILIYLHGLGSTGNTPKTKALRDALEPLGVTTFAPDLPISPIEVGKIVTKVIFTGIKNDPAVKFVFAGTSLGGFYARLFGEMYDAPYIIVNPAINPSEGLRHFIDEPCKSWVTGEPIIIKEETLTLFKDLEEEFLTEVTGSLANVFLAKDDDVIPYETAQKLFKHANTLSISSIGGHRFESNWNDVVDCAKKLFS